MSEEAVEKGVVVWGIPVPMKPNGQRNWPVEIKSMAAEKVAAGATIIGLAEEIGANKSLVAKWVRGIPSKGASGKFVEVFGPDKTAAHHPTGSSQVPICRIRLGDTVIECEPGYPAEHLSTVLQAVRRAQ